MKGIHVAHLEEQVQYLLPLGVRIADQKARGSLSREERERHISKWLAGSPSPFLLA